MNKRRWPLWKRNLALLWAGQFAVTLGLTGMTPFMVFHIRAMIGEMEGEALAGWTALALGGPSAAYMLATPFWGRLGDRISRKWMVVRALGGLAICMAGMAYAPTAAVFVLFRLLQGALGGIYDAATAMIAVTAPPERKGEAIGRYQQAVTAGMLAGPLIGGWFVGRIGTDAFLLGAAALTGLCCAAAALLLREGEAANRSSQDQQAFSELPVKGGVWACLQSFWRDREIRAYITAAMLARCMASAGVTLLPLYLLAAYPEEGIGLANRIGWLEAIASLGALYGAVYFAKASDRGRSDRLLIMALLLCTLCVGLQAALPMLAALLLLKLGQGFAYSAVQPLVMRAIVHNSGNGRQGVSIGTANSLLVAGQLAGAALPAAIAGWTGASGGLALTALLPLAGALIIYQSSFTKKLFERGEHANHAGS
ncbi:MFS transporter [Paenibacillus sedimenti]|uniref:MFS transporter n=1 Tax=Paenibacillus sedimenti TaxID=2770274 RepID=A0A926KSW2_9BACL|nr:MFS transporter [Paenibacillus sedimenti]MBD0383537.1 MFS transporter [Paenibacillus sedimenti]